MRKVQQIHLYLGTLFAPLIIFFAFTGALQTFSLHEREGAPAWIGKLAEIHKNQRLATDSGQEGKPPRPAQPPKPKGGRPAGAAGEGQAPKVDAQAPRDGEPPAPRAPSLPLKIFTLLMSIGLIVTTGLGIWMSFKYSRDKRVPWALLLAGTLLPIAMLFL